MDYHYTRYIDHLEVQINGDFDILEAIDKFSMLLEYCRSVDCRKILIDYRQTGNIPSGTLRHLYQFSIEDTYRKYMMAFNKSISFASIHTLLTTDIYGAENDTFLFNMKNRSFDNLEEARNWLKV